MPGKVNFIIQSKGGIGKSLVASLLYQYLQAKEVQVLGLDTDPANQTFAGIQGLGVEKLEIMDGDEIDATLFDTFVELALELPEGSQLVVDSGSSNYFKLIGYLKSSQAFGVIQEAGHEVRLHTIITGGDAAEATFLRVRDLAVDFPAVAQVVWKNYFFGPVVLMKKTFEETDLYQDFNHLFHALIEIPNLDKDTFGRDLARLLVDRRSFSEAAQGNNYPVMTRQRLKIFWDKARHEMDKGNLI